MSFIGELLKAGVQMDGIVNPLSITSVVKTLADDGTYNLPDATPGAVIVVESLGAEAMIAGVSAAGVCALIGGTTNTAVTDADGSLCVYDGGTRGVVKNRLGSSKTVYIIHVAL